MKHSSQEITVISNADALRRSFPVCRGFVKAEAARHVGRVCLEHKMQFNPALLIGGTRNDLPVEIN